MVAVDVAPTVAAETDVKDGMPAVKDGQATLDVVQQRLEELLSKDNFSVDAFIQQNTNAQMYIPISVLGSHHSLATLGVDIGMLLAAARRSEKLCIDEDNLLVRPLMKPKRSTLILHDLPEGITEEELRELFGPCPEAEALESVKPDVNNTAFVSFATDKSAQEAALWLRSQQLRGASIKCAVKTDHFLRGFFPASTAAQQQMYNNQALMWGAASTPPWMTAEQQLQWQQQIQWEQGEFYGTNQAGGTDEGAYGQGAGKDSGGGKDRGGKGKGGKGKGRRRGERDTMNAAEAWSEHGTPLMQPMQAPDHLTGAPQDSELDAGVDGDGEMHPLGYTHDYRRSSRARIIEVCNSMDEIGKPESYTRFEAEHPDGANLFRQSPCKDWAPLPTPQIPFMMAGGADGADGGGPYNPQRSRKGTDHSWGRSRTMSGVSGASGEGQEDGSGDWDGWGEKGGGKWTRKWNERQPWPPHEDANAAGWEETGWSGYAGPRWVEKGSQDPAAEKRERRPRSRSASRKHDTKWVEKAAAGTAPEKNWGPMWHAKSTSEEVKNDEGTTDAASTVAGAGGASEEKDKEQPAEKDNTDQDDMCKKPSWADKVRQGKSAATATTAAAAAPAAAGAAGTTSPTSGK